MLRVETQGAVESPQPTKDCWLEACRSPCHVTVHVINEADPGAEVEERTPVPQSAPDPPHPVLGKTGQAGVSREGSGR